MRIGSSALGDGAATDGLADGTPGNPSAGTGGGSEAVRAAAGPILGPDEEFRTVFASARVARGMMTRRSLRRLRIIVVFQSAVTTLDMLGVALLGIVAVLAVSLLGGGGSATAYTSKIPLVADASPLLAIAAAGAAATLLLAAKSLVSWRLGRYNLRFMARESVAFSRLLCEAYMTAPFAVAQQVPTQRVIASISSVANGLASVLTYTSALWSESTLLVGLSLLMLGASPALFLFAVAYFGLIGILVSRGVGGIAQRTHAASIDASVGAQQRLGNMIGLARELRVYRMWGKFCDQYDAAARTSALSQAELTSWVGAPRYFLEISLVVGVATAAVIVALTQTPDRAALSVGLFIVASGRIIPAVQRMNGAWSGAKRAVGQLSATDDVLRFEPSRAAGSARATSLSAVPRGSRSLVIEDVTFTYPGSSTPAVSHLSAVVAMPSRVAIVGRSGAGKSTLGDLLLGLIEPTEGRIFVSEGGQRLPLPTAAFVAQDVFVSPDTVRANIALAVPGEQVADDAVWKAVELADLTAVIEALPDGLDTGLGERGIRLSGGQRQRIGLARALFQKPQLLVLDEATSSLDAQTERTVTDAIRGVPGEVTVVTIAHRLATVRESDTVLLLDQGRLIDAAPFDDLVGRHPDVARAAELQGLA